jgi:hypothetical protein
MEWGAAFVTELITQLPKEAVLRLCVAWKEFNPELEALGYAVPQSGEVDIKLTDQQNLRYLIEHKNLLNQTDHFNIAYGNLVLFTAYDRMQSTWLSTKVQLNGSFIDRFELELEPDGKSWLVPYHESEF